MIRRAALAAGAACCLAGAGVAPSPGAAEEHRRLLHTIHEVPAAIRGCWEVPAALRGFERLEATVRFSLRADGSLLGEQRASFVAFPLDGPGRDLLRHSVLEAVAACTPLPLSAGLGAAIAGRVFAVRFVYVGPKGRGA